MLVSESSSVNYWTVKCTNKNREKANTGVFLVMSNKQYTEQRNSTKWDCFCNNNRWLQRSIHSWQSSSLLFYLISVSVRVICSQEILSNAIEIYNFFQVYRLAHRNEESWENEGYGGQESLLSGDLEVGMIG